MSFGMHGVASEQLGPAVPGGDTSDLGISLEASQRTEIVVLSQQRSEEAAKILRERYLSGRPLSRYGRMLKCQQEPPAKGAGAAGGSSRARSKGSGSVGAALCKKLSEFLPVLEWLPAVTCRSARADLIAGLTVGVMVIPQSMSYANIAGLPYVFGMYAACVPTFVYAFLGQSRQLAVGPVAMVSLLVQGGITSLLNKDNCPEWFEAPAGTLTKSLHEVCVEPYVRLAILTAAVAGVVQILARVLKLGFLVSFLGHPVSSGFTSAAAIIIGLSQFKHMLGYDIEKSEFVHITLGSIFTNIEKVQPVTLCLGLIWLLLLVVARKLSQRFKKCSMLGPLAPLIGCVAGSLLVWAAAPLREEHKVKVVGDIQGGLFPVSVGSWRLDEAVSVIPTALSVCLIGFMESIAIGKNLAMKNGYEIDAGQEMLALGVANLVGSVFSSYPVTGSFSRSAVSNATGAVSQLSGLITATVMLCTLIFLTPAFYFLPNFVLAAIVIASVLPLVAYGEAIRLWSIRRKDFVLWMCAFLGTLFLGVLLGITLAVLLSLAIVIYESVRPQIMILWRIPGTTIYRNVKQESGGAFIPNVLVARIGSSLYFANASFVKEMLLGYVEDLEEVNSTRYIVLEMTPVVSVDSTALHVIEDIVSDFRGRGIQTAFAMVGNRVDRTFRRAKLTDFIGEHWFFPTVNEAVGACLRHQAAKKIRQRQEEGAAAAAGEGADGAAEEHPVHPGTEIGLSNDLHYMFTAITIHLQRDVPMIMSDIADALKRSYVTVSRAQVEPLAGEQGEGAKHVYFVRSVLHPGKLTEHELAALRVELSQLLAARQEQAVSGFDVGAALNNGKRERGSRGQHAIFEDPTHSNSTAASSSSAHITEEV